MQTKQEVEEEQLLQREDYLMEQFQLMKAEFERQQRQSEKMTISYVNTFYTSNSFRSTDFQTIHGADIISNQT